MTITTDLPTPARALAIGAHPDDVDFHCGATLARWAEAGCEVSYLVCTDGSRGSWDTGADIPALVQLRQTEQRAAAKVLGATGALAFLGWPDGELEEGPRQVSQVVHQIRKLRPDVVLGHDPWKRYRLHPDHRHAGFLTVDAVAIAREPHALPEQELPAHRPETLLLFEADEPDHVERAEDPHLMKKLEALEQHRSQFRSTMFIEAGQNYESQLETFREKVRQKMQTQGSLARAPLAESFKLIKDL